MRPPAAAPRPPSLRRRVAGQGALLFTGFALAQAMSFGRNAIIGHGLSKADFGVAATIALMLQLTETLSDLGVDRVVVQAPDGNRPRLIATAQSVLAIRGALTSLILFLCAGPIATFFNVETALRAFHFAALVPFIKGFINLDARRAQRRLDNRQHLAIEVLPQAAVLALTLPCLWLDRSYNAVVSLSLLQASLAVAVSHMVATRGWRVALDRTVLKRLIAFGWPIWASAFPLIAVYQADRILVGRLYGMELLASYSAAVMVTMVPGLIAAKIGNALMLPLLAGAGADNARLKVRFGIMCELTAVAACAYLVLFIVAGGPILRLAFGHKYGDLGPLAAWLALMWTLRMVQAVPGMALMARGATRPLLNAGLIRAASLILVVLAAWADLGLPAIAAAGSVGELCSLLYIANRADKEARGLGWLLITRTALIVPSGLFACGLVALLGFEPGLPLSIGAAGVAIAGIVGTAVLGLPGLRSHVSALDTKHWTARGRAVLHRESMGTKRAA